MPDREEVISELEKWINYMDEDVPVVVLNAYELLKAKEPVFEGHNCKCPRCGSLIDLSVGTLVDKACRKCGQVFDWKGGEGK